MNQQSHQEGSSRYDRVRHIYELTNPALQDPFKLDADFVDHLREYFEDVINREFFVSVKWISPDILRALYTNYEDFLRFKLSCRINNYFGEQYLQENHGLDLCTEDPSSNITPNLVGKNLMNVAAVGSVKYITIPIPVTSSGIYGHSDANIRSYSLLPELCGHIQENIGVSFQWRQREENRLNDKISSRVKEDQRRFWFRKFFNSEVRQDFHCNYDQKFWHWCFYLNPNNQRSEIRFKSMSQEWMDYMFKQPKFRETLRRWLDQNEKKIVNEVESIKRDGAIAFTGYLRRIIAIKNNEDFERMVMRKVGYDYDDRLMELTKDHTKNGHMPTPAYAYIHKDTNRRSCHFQVKENFFLPADSTLPAPKRNVTFFEIEYDKKDESFSASRCESDLHDLLQSARESRHWRSPDEDDDDDDDDDEEDDDEVEDEDMGAGIETQQVTTSNQPASNLESSRGSAVPETNSADALVERNQCLIATEIFSFDNLMLAAKNKLQQFKSSAVSGISSVSTPFAEYLNATLDDEIFNVYFKYHRAKTAKERRATDTREEQVDNVIISNLKALKGSKYREKYERKLKNVKSMNKRDDEDNPGSAGKGTIRAVR